MNAVPSRQTVVEPEYRGSGTKVVTRSKDALDPRLASIIERLSGDENLVYLAARAHNYAQLTEARMEALRAALARGDGEEVASVAHALTDSVTKLGAIKMMKHGISLQMLGRRGLLDAAHRVFDELEAEYRVFKRHLICEWQ